MIYTKNVPIILRYRSHPEGRNQHRYLLHHLSARIPALRAPLISIRPFSVTSIKGKALPDLPNSCLDPTSSAANARFIHLDDHTSGIGRSVVPVVEDI